MCNLKLGFTCCWRGLQCIQPVKSTIVLDVPYKRSLCTLGLSSAQPCVESCGVEMCPSTQATHPPPPSHLPPYPSHHGISPLAALQKDGLRWSTPRRFVRSQICDQQVANNVNIAIYFPCSISFLWNTTKIFCLLSIDCYYLFRLINHNN
jgi:hypothetical protein